MPSSAETVSKADERLAKSAGGCGGSLLCDHRKARASITTADTDTLSSLNCLQHVGLEKEEAPVEPMSSELDSK